MYFSALLIFSFKVKMVLGVVQIDLGSKEFHCLHTMSQFRLLQQSTTGWVAYQ